MSSEKSRRWFSFFTRELAHSARSLRRSPTFSAIAFVTLALGIGATTAIYTVLDAVVLSPLPYPKAEQLVSILHPATVPGSGERKWGLSTGGYFQIKAQNHSFATVGIYSSSATTITNGGQAELSQVARVTATMFPVLQARAKAGRLITDADDQPGAPLVAVLSDEFLRRRFGGDVSMVGKNLETSGGLIQIVGIAEPGLTLPMPGPFASTANLAGFGVDVWLPLQANPNGPFYNNHPYVGVGRLLDGVSIPDAQRDIERIFSTFTESMPQAYSPGFIKQYNFRIEATPLRDAVLGPTIPGAMWMLFGAVAFVLLIASANAFNLFLVRMETRRRESAVRTALGASRGQMALHHIAESLLLCLAAASAGILLALGALKGLLAIAPTDVPRLASVALNWRSALIALGVGALLGVLLGILPLLRRELDLSTLREGARGSSSSPRQKQLRDVLVVAQVALALVLLVSAGVMLTSFDRLRSVDPGFDPENSLVFDISLPFTEYPTHSAAIAFHEELQRRISDLPGVVAVGALSDVPLEGYGTGCTVVYRENKPYAAGEETPCVSTPTASPGVFDALGIEVDGRTPEWRDVTGRTQAVVVTKALADRLWPGETAIGKGINSNGQKAGVWYRVVGVAPRLRAEALDAPQTEAAFYALTSLSTRDAGGDLNDLSYVVRTANTDPTLLIPQLRTIVFDMNQRIPFVNARAMSQVMSRSTARSAFIMTLLAIASAVALILSVVGIYGVVSYIVAQRRTEIGIRMALGASVRRVVGMVMLHSLSLASAGVILGVFGAFVTARLLAALLFETNPTDPKVLGSVAIALLVVALGAALGPARRAAMVDPAETIRSS